MRSRYLGILMALAIATVAIYVGVGGAGVREGKVVDELGEVHEVVMAGPYVVIKHGPSAYQIGGDFNKTVKYIEARRASWERWKRLLDKHGNETYKAYVVPCRIYQIEEFPTLAKNLSLTDKIVEIVTYVYYKNGTYTSLGYSVRPEGYSLDAWLKSIREVALISTGRHILFLEWWRSNNGTGTPPPPNITKAVEVGGSVAEVYVGAFVVEAPLRELYALSKKPEILMVDTPLDLIWKYREEGKTVVVKRVTYGEKYLIEKKNLCQGRDK
ncbi:hypothetical protein [Pyrobaculum ferrireducens]|uniref:Uncharacterized protein n=1 Tax=Pyrobaculum ferrireducens TaxID=1104324 RepID=G7VEG2_9CREN|nr:hypothetical protein [Pyrobaculum ferrireducens]AET31586.1 hypothetical protein P186_0118 [Pyrobaculum ferrireducens]